MKRNSIIYFGKCKVNAVPVGSYFNCFSLSAVVHGVGMCNFHIFNLFRRNAFDESGVGAGRKFTYCFVHHISPGRVPLLRPTPRFSSLICRFHSSDLCVNIMKVIVWKAAIVMDVATRCPDAFCCRALFKFGGNLWIREIKTGDFSFW